MGGGHPHRRPRGGYLGFGPTGDDAGQVGAGLRWAKWKTFIQLGAVGWTTWPTFTDWRWLSDSWLWASVLIAWVTAVQYVLAGSRATSSTGEATKT